jgi:hypothetical protein
MTAKVSGLLQIGSFAPEIQSRLDAEFDCLRVDDLERDPGRAGGIRALVTRNPK